jgi:hypothetical protein
VLSVLFSLITVEGSAQRAPVEPAPVRQLHCELIRPSSDAIFNVASEAPKNAEGWTAVAGSGVSLAKSGHLMMLQAPASNRHRWMMLSRQLTLVGRTAQRAAQARNLELIEASYRLIIVCESCHARYRNKNPTSGDLNADYICPP